MGQPVSIQKAGTDGKHKMSGLISGNHITNEGLARPGKNGEHRNLVPHLTFGGKFGSLISQRNI